MVNYGRFLMIRVLEISVSLINHGRLNKAVNYYKYNKSLA